MQPISFSGLNLRPEILNALAEMGFENPTPVQAESIPPVLEGRDLVGHAQTGTGKTAAFGIPAISKTDVSNSNVQILIQSPTRELAIQITGELIKIGKFIEGLHITPVYGGQHISRQLSALKRGAQIVVGTPGRTIDHLKRGTLNLSNLKMLVFDEADEMLNMGFREDMEEIQTYVGHKVQTVMFSATVPDGIRRIMNKYMENPYSVEIDRKKITAPDIAQYFVEVRDSVRTEAISRLMDVHGYKLGLVFTNTKRQTESIAQELQARGFGADIINGDLTQNQRDRVMARYRRGELDLLVATDVAARGIDVSEVDVVFNYEIPQDPEYYVHRIGRTGRAGRTGTSITFMAGNKKRRLRTIEKQIGHKLQPLAMPSLSDVHESRVAGQITELEEVLNKGGLKPYIEQIEMMAEGDFTSIEIAAALLKMRVGGLDEMKQNEENFQQKQSFDDSGMVRLYFSVGKQHRVSPGDLVGAIAGESGIPGKEIGEITINRDFSLVDIPGQYIDQVLRAMSKATIKRQRVKVRPDKFN